MPIFTYGGKLDHETDGGLSGYGSENALINTINAIKPPTPYNIIFVSLLPLYN